MSTEFTCDRKRESICPKTNTLIFCLWFNERCNSENPCGENEECCSDNCGTFCHSAPAVTTTPATAGGE
ncbi:WAP-type 'four-disulfide core' domain [Trinorchestia longiramus]|nr:WAP-type 'four-disulfide core' domain [Trinorchestia longiramus]